MQPIPSHMALVPVPTKKGRPGEYDPAYCDVARNACARGATIAELADILKCNRSTIYRWRAQHQEFCDAIKVGKEVADERVGFSLYERAVGYTYNAVKIMQYEGEVIREEYLEHVPPDVGAQKHWLANRQPDKWRTSDEPKVNVVQVFLDLHKLVSSGKARELVAA